MTEDEDDWRQCAEWLNRCHILPDDDPILGLDGNALQLVHTLMDGVALCRLLGTLSNNCVDIRTMKDFSPNPQNSQFLCCQNIRLFTQLCEKEFDIPRSYLISPNDIYQAKNFGKAIALLSKLSLTARAQSTGIIGFPPENTKLQTTHEYYNNLEEYAANMDTLPDLGRTNYTQMDEETKEKLYDTVVHNSATAQYVATTAPAASVTTVTHSSSNNLGVIGSGGATSSSNSISSTSVNSESDSTRQICVSEIIETEKNYVDLLKMLMDKYKMPLTGILSPEELDEVLKYIEDLHTIHRELWSNLLLATTQKMSAINMSKVFLQVRDRLLIYGEYCGHVQRAQSLVVELMRNDVTKRSRIDMCQVNSGKYSKFHLTDLLTVPIQRVLKYHLLLDQLCKLTPTDHPERAGLLQAHEAMRELAQSINEVKRDLDTISAIDQIQASLLEITLPADKKLSSYGRRHMDGEVKVLNSTELKAKIRYLFLFDKTLLVCKPKGDSFTFMLAYHVINGSGKVIPPQGKKGEKYSYGFTLPISVDRQMIVPTFFAKSVEIRDTWLRAAEAAISNLYPPGGRDKGYNFEMHTFTQPTYCCICSKLLQGIFYQGYRCRETGYTAHKPCLLHVKTNLRPAITSNLNSNNSTMTNHPSMHSNGVTSGLGSTSWGGGSGGGTLRVHSAHPSSLAQSSSATMLGRHSMGSVSSGNMSTVTSSVSSSLIHHPSTAGDLSSHFSSMSFANQCVMGTEAPHPIPVTTNASMVAAYQRRLTAPPLGCPPTGLHPTCATVRVSYSGEMNPPILDCPLSLSPGDQVEISSVSDDGGWCRGRCNGIEGWFPAQILEPLSLRSPRATMDMGQLSRGCAPIFCTSSTPPPPPPLPPLPSGLSFGSVSSLVHPPPSGRHSWTVARTAPPIPSGRHTMIDVRDGDRASNLHSSNSTTPHMRTPSADQWVTFDLDSSSMTSPSVKCPLDPNDPLSGYDWYMGEMDRQEAVTLLTDCDAGTFLVRVSKSAERSGEYSLSLVYGYPRHIRIQRLRSHDGLSVSYGLCELEQFVNIAALIEHYSKVSLNRCFDEVDTTLMHPYHKCPPTILFYAWAKFNFHYEANPYVLRIRLDDRIAVLSQDAEGRGWWKGWLHGRIGYFPMSYVVTESSNT